MDMNDISLKRCILLLEILVATFRLLSPAPLLSPCDSPLKIAQLEHQERSLSGTGVLTERDSHVELRCGVTWPVARAHGLPGHGWRCWGA